MFSNYINIYTLGQRQLLNTSKTRVIFHKKFECFLHFKIQWGQLNPRRTFKKLFQDSVIREGV